MLLPTEHVSRIAVWLLTIWFTCVPYKTLAITPGAYLAAQESMRQEEERARAQQLHELEIERQKLQLEYQHLQLMKLREQLEANCRSNQVGNASQVQGNSQRRCP